MSDKSNIKKIITDLMAYKTEAVVKKDRTTLLDLLHPEFQYINSQGKISGRLEYVDTMLNKMEWLSQTVRDVHFTHIENAVYLDALVDDHFIYADVEYTGTFRTFHVYLFEDTKWLWFRGMSVNYK